MKSRLLFLVPLLAALAVLVETGGRQTFQLRAADPLHPFQVLSNTFRNYTEVPQSMVYNGVLGNTCSGENRSPELSWTGAAPSTRTFVVMGFDVTASFTHWGMYNIPSSTTNLPGDAGLPGSKYGDQITNDAGNVGYSGPCPPPGLLHDYVFTVYALDTYIAPPSSAQFPANAETLLRAMLGHVLESTSITGLYSTR